MTAMVTVYDPHPGLAGCLAPLPESLRLEVEAMAGRRLPLEEVIARLRASVSDGAFKIHDGFISYGAGRQLLAGSTAPNCCFGSTPGEL